METLIDFKTFMSSPPSWGHRSRRAVFEAACKYLDLSPTNVKNMNDIVLHSVLHSNSVQLSGSILEKVKRDPAIVREQDKLLAEIFHDINLKKEKLKDRIFFLHN